MTRVSEEDFTIILKQAGYSADARPQTTIAEQAKQIQAIFRERLENIFLQMYRVLNGPGEWERNYKFLGDSGYQLDFAMPDIRVGVEVNGGQWVKSGHSSGQGLQRDAQKQNLAIVNGWHIFWLTTNMVDDTYHVQQVIDYVKFRQGLPM